ncbi:MAG: Nif11-like leader peptide family natural product precursor [Eggerthellaceae bacterium]|nr:Nif11-like leader peptide family natural product precursor [Eggerthellaceae bacterium]
MDFKDLSPELQDKARKCKTPEEVLALAKEEGYELSDEELKAVSGAGISWSLWCSDQTCPRVCSSDF